MGERARGSWPPHARCRRCCAGTGIGHEIFPAIGLERDHIAAHSIRRLDGPLKLLFVGRFVRWKGMDLAIEAVALAKGEAQLTFVGGGDESVAASLRQLAGRLGVAGRVQFAGQRPRTEVLAAYLENDAFLFPSQHKPGGFAVIEAMAAGLPVICLDCGGPALAVAAGCGPGSRWDRGGK